MIILVGLEKTIILGKNGLYLINVHLTRRMINRFVILSLPHVKFGLMKKVVKALDKNGLAFQYLKIVFPNLSDAKLEERIFMVLQMRNILKNKNFHRH